MAPASRTDVPRRPEPGQCPPRKPLNSDAFEARILAPKNSPWSMRPSMGAPFSEVTTGRRKLDELRATRSGEREGKRLAFGPFVLEPESGRAAGRRPRDRPRAQALRDALLPRPAPGRVVPKTELMERLWPGTFVTDDVLVQCVVDIRRALHDPAKTPHYVQTVPRRGYQFLAPVREAEPARTRPPMRRTRPRPPEAPGNRNGSRRPNRRRRGASAVGRRAGAALAVAPPRPSPLAPSRGGQPRVFQRDRRAGLPARDADRGRGTDVRERLDAPGPGRDDQRAARPDAGHPRGGAAPPGRGARGAGPARRRGRRPSTRPRSRAACTPRSSSAGRSCA